MYIIKPVHNQRAIAVLCCAVLCCAVFSVLWIEHSQLIKLEEEVVTAAILQTELPVGAAGN
jgi:hypothetical protein